LSDAVIGAVKQILIGKLQQETKCY